MDTKTIQTNELSRQRALLNKLKSDSRYKASKEKITRSFLRQEVVITNTNSKYEFDFNQDSSKQGNKTERLLRRQDIFYADSVGMFLVREVAAELGTGVLQTYPNPVAFPAAAGFTPADLEIFYNAFLSAQIDQKIFFEFLDTQLFLCVPESQQIAAGIERSQRSPNDGFIDLEPNLVLSGKRTNKLEINVPTFAGAEVASVTAGTDHKIVMYARGFLIPGVAYD